MKNFFKKEDDQEDNKIVSGCLVAIIVLALCFIEPWILMLLWNNMVVFLFTWANPITSYWTACGLIVACNILFGGLRIGEILDN